MITPQCTAKQLLLDRHYAGSLLARVQRPHSQSGPRRSCTRVRAAAAPGLGPGHWPWADDDSASSSTKSGGSSGNGVGPMHLADDHLLSAPRAATNAAPGVHGGSANGNSHPHLPFTIFANFPKLPPEGSTLTPEEQKCNPDTERCRTPIHVWESKCSACGGTGTAKNYTSHQRHRILSVCLLCHGLGYVRHSSTHVEKVPYVNGSGPHTTIGRPPAPEAKKPRRWPLPGSLKQPPPEPPRWRP